MYWTCQGSVSVLALAVPPLHEAVPTDAALTNPISRPEIFEMDLLWKFPLRVTGHETLTPPPAPNRSAVHFIAKLVELVSMRVADALLSARAMNAVAAKAASRSLLRVRMFFHFFVIGASAGAALPGTLRDRDRDSRPAGVRAGKLSQRVS